MNQQIKITSFLDYSQLQTSLTVTLQPGLLFFASGTRYGKVVNLWKRIHPAVNEAYYKREKSQLHTM